MTAAEINAYLEWRAMREGKTVDVSPEAFERDQIIERIVRCINGWQSGPADPSYAPDTLAYLGIMCQELDALEKEN